MGFLAALIHPIRWTRFFVRAMIGGQGFSLYDDMVEGYGSDGYSDRDDESYYGL